MSRELEKNYSPSGVEQRVYSHWEQNDCFSAKVNPDKEPFCIVIPPPNVTGRLHLGHALDNTLQDILIRYKKMCGFEALWLPGTDHAGIATQIKVEEMLRVDEGITKYDLGREKFLERVWDWKNKYGSEIIGQLKKLGCACDWEKERFTMDDGCSLAVRETFISLYEKGLIYKGERIINWCPDCKTALSDSEVNHEEQASHLWHIKYKITGTQDYLICATTRPETMLGDTGIAVNPNDDRYKHLIGKTAIVPLVNREVPIFADEYVELDFGTGCVKVTPAHDPNDFEMGQRHNLESIIVIGEDGKITKEGGKFEGIERFEARKAVVKALEESGELVKIEDMSHNVGLCYRCNSVIEPLTSTQWFVKMRPLAEISMKAVREGDIKITPKRFDVTYFNWMENVRDWCISRQLWWGHRIPAFYCTNESCGEMTVSREDISVCPKCNSAVKQDEDVLDTWFSSQLWPFSTLGWPEKTPELDYFYPTSVLVTGYDILFFWVARMILAGLDQLGMKPFDDVLLHGLVRDGQGRKMSKSLGNGIDPLEVIDKYGADALRFSLMTGNSPGNDTRFSWEKVESNRTFSNKIWNASRFVLMNITLPDEELFTLPETLETEDKWILTQLNKLAGEMRENLDKFELGVALAKVNDFIWDKFCDWYIELSKSRLFESNTNVETNHSAQKVLVYVLRESLKLLHPFMPFITEELYLALPHKCKSIMFEDFPKYDEALNFATESAQMEKIMAAITALRTRRSEMGVVPSKRAALYIETAEQEIFEKGIPFFTRLASTSEVHFTKCEDENAVVVVTDGARLFVPLGELVDLEAERKRLLAEKEKLEGEIARIDDKLSNEGFVKKAPPQVIEAEKEKLEKYKAMLAKTMESLG